MNDPTTIIDPKLGERSVLYLPAEAPMPPAVEDLQRRGTIQVKRLPEVIKKPGQLDPNQIHPHGVLYLENKYVVPGGRFNEMYGWDSYFIIRGLLLEGKLELARGMVENFFYEIEHYGCILNANRTYYLSRSQPPFLSSMILAIHDAEKAAGKDNHKWMTKAYGYAVRDHEMWTHEPHCAGSTGLSRFYDFGDGPAPEGIQDEIDHYRAVAAYFINHPHQDRGYVLRNPIESKESAGKIYAVRICDSGIASLDDGCAEIVNVALSHEFYRADRSMRESGFDVTFRFGPHGCATHHFTPVCLNSLLYKTEKDLETMATLLGKTEEAQRWCKTAENRQQRIDKYLWDESRGQYFDYNIEAKGHSSYEYLTTYYPLWVGVATQKQAEAVVSHMSRLERPGGLVMSPYETDSQWDYPYAWAPLQLIAVEGLRRYGFSEAADRISYNFLSMVADNYRKSDIVCEKYNGATRSCQTEVKVGYRMNVVGFGWTNGVFLELLKQLSPEKIDQLSREQLQPA